MKRRGFLSLLAATPLLPMLARFSAFEEIEREAAPTLPAAERWETMQVMGVPSTLVAAGRIERIELRPQRLFRPSRFIVPTLAYGFEVLHVASAGEPVLEDGVPAELFSPLAFASSLRWAVVSPGETIVLVVRNLRSELARFDAAILGQAVRS